MERSPSDSYSLTLRVKLSTRAGTLGEVATAIGRAGGDIGAIDIVSVARDYIVRDITVNTVSANMRINRQCGEAIDGIEVVQVSDRTFLMHIGGKIEVVSKMPLKTPQICRWHTRPASRAFAKLFTTIRRRCSP